jgi:DNA-binding CsgD family transcriptional regulator
MSDGPITSLNQAQHHLDAGNWQAACNDFRAALDAKETGDGWFGLSEALWWLGQFKEAVDCRERAYAKYRQQSNPAKAADVAVKLCIDYRACLGNGAASDGWLARTAQLVRAYELEPTRGWLHLLEATTSSATDGEERARVALEHARKFDDPDLELCAMSEIGAMLIKQGQIPKGVSWLDEAMAGSLGGEGRAPDTVVFTSCNMILSCAACAEFDRVLQWVAAADRFMERYGCLFLLSVCRATYGKVLIATGDWNRAEQEVDAAIGSSKGSPLYVLALAALAELRLAQGRIEEAERLLAGFEDLEPTAPVLAAVHLARGEPVVARAILRRILQTLGDNHLQSAMTSELLGQTEIALGQTKAAAARGQRLAEAGTEFHCDAVLARGERLWGKALALDGQTVESRTHLGHALGLFARMNMPLEAARTRLILADAVREHEPEVAKAEALAAASTFENLEARRDANEASSLLRALGVRSGGRGGGPRAYDKLTKREREVLACLAEGLSNPEIAGRLFISRKTVEHHVAKILAKLGVRSRAQAAAEAVRRRAAENPPQNR